MFASGLPSLPYRDPALSADGLRPQSWVADAIVALLANGSQVCEIARLRPSNAEGQVVRSSRRNVVERTDYRWSFVVWLRRLDSPTHQEYPTQTAQPQ